MFDLRYHVASLTAVFVALVVGILVGVGLSGKGFVNDAERSNLNDQIADLRRERDSARASLDQATQGALALKDFSDAAYPAVVPGRLAGTEGGGALRRPRRPGRLVRGRQGGARRGRHRCPHPLARGARST